MPLKGEDSLIGADDADGGAGEIVTDFDERLKLRLDAKEASAAGEPDVVRFGESGWKDRYYAAKLHAPIGDISIRRYVVKCYVEVLPSQLFPPEPTTQAPLRTLQPATHMVYAPRLVAQGLCWVLMYYYQGVQDWGWFYPFHYAPCASDLVGLDEFAGGQFDIGAAFTPFQQLMAVFPPASGHALPSAYRAPPPTIASSLPRSPTPPPTANSTSHCCPSTSALTLFASSALAPLALLGTLMVHPSSPIIDFYPIDFGNDLNGKKFSWQAIAYAPHGLAPQP